tara:strand:+ start:286 stop:1410 length:1125 start_codon:yes stop_codon:yes gene_type:complete
MKTKYPYYKEGISVDDLELDKNNPRLPNYMRGKSESEIIDYMILEESTLELMQAIGEKGFFPGEQLLVVAKGNKFIVVEGNRRLTAVKLLNNPDIATAQSTIVKKIEKEAPFKNIQSLPCMVFEKEEDIHDYLGYRHVTGIQSWNLRQKAQYLTYLKEKNFPKLSIDKASNEIRKMIGSKSDYVKRVLVGFMVFQKIKDNKFFSIKNLNDDGGFYFSYIADSLRQPNIVSYLDIQMDEENPISKLNIDHLKNWTTWLYAPIEYRGRITTRLKGKSQDLNQLNAILGNEEAKKQFIVNDATLSEAYTYTEDFDKTFKNAIEYALQEIERADKLKIKIKSFYSSIEDDLRSIIQTARAIKATKDELEKTPFEGDDF